MITERKDLLRFLKFVCFSDECWNWTSANVRGYGRFGIKGRTYNAPRLIWSSLVGDIPSGMQIDHLCRNESCVRPSHLQVVTPRENVHRSMSRAGVNARKTHCIYGHELIGNNLILSVRDGKTHRDCRLCMQERSRRYRRSYREVRT